MPKNYREPALQIAENPNQNRFTLVVRHSHYSSENSTQTFLFCFEAAIMTTASVNWFSAVLPESIENQIYEALTVEDLALTRRVCSAAKQTLDNPELYKTRSLEIETVTSDLIKFVETHALKKIKLGESVELRFVHELFQNLPTTTEIHAFFDTFTKGATSFYRQLIPRYTFIFCGQTSLSELIWLDEHNQHDAVKWVVIASADRLRDLISHIIRPFLSIEVMDLNVTRLDPATVWFLELFVPFVERITMHIYNYEPMARNLDFSNLPYLKTVQLDLFSQAGNWSFVKLPKLDLLLLKILPLALPRMWTSAVEKICYSQAQYVVLQFLKMAGKHSDGSVFMDNLFNPARGLRLRCESLHIETSERVFGSTLQTPRSAKVTGCQNVTWVATEFTHKVLLFRTSTLLRVFGGISSFAIKLCSDLMANYTIDEEIVRINGKVFTRRNSAHFIFNQLNEEDTVVTEYQGL